MQINGITGIDVNRDGFTVSINGSETQDDEVLELFGEEEHESLQQNHCLKDCSLTVDFTYYPDDPDDDLEYENGAIICTVLKRHHHCKHPEEVIVVPHQIVTPLTNELALQALDFIENKIAEFKIAMMKWTPLKASLHHDE